MLKELKEGEAKILVDTSDIVSKDLEVFYNPKMDLNRTLSITVLKALQKDNLQIALPLAGTGVRAIRMLLELKAEKIKNIEINDLNPKMKDYVNKSLELNKLNSDKLIIHEQDANQFLQNAKGFDYIDIDPFGSPNFLLDTAIRKISREGILAVSATDTGALAGTFVDAGKRKYWSISLKCPQQHELGLRILTRKVQLLGIQHDKALEPIFSYHFEHYYRIFFKVRKGRQIASKLYDKNNSFFHHCEKCSFNMTDENKIKACPKCENKFSIAGPIYNGEMNNKEFLSEMKKFEKNKIGIKLIETALQELNIVGFYDTHNLGKRLKFTVGKLDKYLEELNKSHKATKASQCETGIKTDAPYEKLIEILKETK